MQEIKQKIFEKIGFELSDREIIYCQKKLNECNVISAVPKKCNLEEAYADINGRLDTFIKKVREDLSLKLEVNEKFREVFFIHMYKLKLRTNYGHDNMNYFRKEIARKYPMTMHIIYEYFIPLFDYVIPDSEIAYIVLYFTDFESRISSVKAALVSNLPMSMLHKTVHSINKYFQNEICSLKVIPRYLYKAEDKDDDYSLIITTEKEMLLQNKELVLIGTVIENEDIYKMKEQIGEAVRNIEEKRCKKLYSLYINEKMFVKINRKMESTDEFLEFSGLKRNKKNYDFVLDSGVLLFSEFLYNNEESCIKAYIFKYPLRYKGRDIKTIVVSGYNIKNNDIKDFYLIIKKLLNPEELKEILKKISM
nr:PRD domain-containing protein [Sebaldella sp. S0638]